MAQVISQKELNESKKPLCWVTFLVDSNSEEVQSSSIELKEPNSSANMVQTSKFCS